MDKFMERYGSEVTHILSGFDRLVLRGTLRPLAYETGMRQFLSEVGVLLKDFGQYAETVTETLKTAIKGRAKALGRPVIYLPSSRTDKEARARTVAEGDRVTEGLVCVLTSVEPCWSYDVRRERATKTLALRSTRRKCLYAYHYFFDETFGWMNARIQTWFPFSIQVCVNGREWLARSMDRAGLGYERLDNLFVKLEDPAAAQRLMDAQQQTHWAAALDAIARRLNPDHDRFLSPWRGQYYWTTHQSEWATDAVWQSPEALAPLYRAWVRAGLLTFGCEDMLRFLGKPLDKRTGGEVVGDGRWRRQQVRLKFRHGENSVKMYDKEAIALRVETTLNDPAAYKSYRPREGDPDGPKTWRPMRRGVADLHRRTEVSQASNHRLLEGLASVDTTATVLDVVGPVCRRTRQDGRSVRALAPWSPDDQALLKCIGRGDFLLNGFRNRDVRAALYKNAPAANEDRSRQAGRVTRLLRLLRAHGVIAKVPQTHRYVLTAQGREIVTAVLQTQNAHVNELARLAA